MNSIIGALLAVLAPPYAWILLLLIALPFWVLFLGVFLQRITLPAQQGASVGRLFHNPEGPAERDLGRYAGLLTAVWLLILVFKVYQQYFAGTPLPHTELGAFDFALGLFSLAAWMGLILLRAQDRV